MIGWFEVRSGQGFKAETDFFIIHDVLEEGNENRALIRIAHAVSLPSSKQKDLVFLGTHWNLENGKIRLFNKEGKLLFWIPEKAKVTKIVLFSSREQFEKAWDTFVKKLV